VIAAAPTSAPQTVQRLWSSRSPRCSFIRAWSARALDAARTNARVMPNRYGAREVEMRGSLPALTVVLHRVGSIRCTELGPTWRDPRGAARAFEPRTRRTRALRGASATGGSAVTSGSRFSLEVVNATPERQPSELHLRSTTFEFGVSVLARSAHVNRAPSSRSRGGSAHNHRRLNGERRCTLQMDCLLTAAQPHGVHG
jgi:hypothetical protein